jgi:hypothetical protein
MALTPNFTSAQTSGEPSKVTLTDTSTGSDGDVASRRVYFTKADGSYLTSEGNDNDYEDWAYADANETFDILDKDYALNIRVVWLNAGGDTLYTKIILTGLTLYNETYDYGLTEMLAANPMLVGDDSFIERKSALRTLIDAGDKAITWGDIYNSQACYNAATLIRTSTNFFV